MLLVDADDGALAAVGHPLAPVLHAGDECHPIAGVEGLVTTGVAGPVVEVRSADLTPVEPIVLDEAVVGVDSFVGRVGVDEQIRH
jgi:hypothetical protein